MSKSKGNVVDPLPLIDRYGLDVLRYYLLREVPFGSDGVFTPEGFIERVNADLANDLGNLLHRTLTMVQKYSDGVVPSRQAESTQEDKKLEQLAQTTVQKVEAAMEKLQFSVAMMAIWELVHGINRYLEETMPWELAKDPANQPRLESVLYHGVEGLRMASILIQPFLVQTPARMWEQLGISAGEFTSWDSLYRFGSFPAGTHINKQKPLFPRLDVEEEAKEIVRMMGGVPVNTVNDGNEEPPAQKRKERKQAEESSVISIEDFNQVDLRVAQVRSAEKIQGADRLLKLQLDLGTETRQVVAGVAQHYEPQELEGKKVIIVANLRPVKLRGELSQGMVLAAKEGDHLVLSTVSGDIPNGTRVK